MKAPCASLSSSMPAACWRAASSISAISSSACCSSALKMSSIAIRRSLRASRWSRVLRGRAGPLLDHEGDDESQEHDDLRQSLKNDDHRGCLRTLRERACACRTDLGLCVTGGERRHGHGEGRSHSLSDGGTPVDGRCRHCLLGEGHGRHQGEPEKGHPGHHPSCETLADHAFFSPPVLWNGWYSCFPAS